MNTAALLRAAVLAATLLHAAVAMSGPLERASRLPDERRAMSVDLRTARIVSPGDAQASAGSGARNDRNVVQLSRLLGMKVEDPQGADLGEIEDVIVDAEAGAVPYAVIGFDPGLFSGERLHIFPLPWFLMPEGGDRDSIVLNADRYAVLNLRGFDDDYWPDLNSAAFRADMQRRFDEPARNRPGH